ncbi:amidohydrolase [Neorhodopirellula pilleata]|uniref:Putative hydrolase YxeP n=1 Tax=Neorhodopirellula pilleata TaxID=2714738 RepID=A0A5C6AN14_9BACT|nr:amidohydrolase [Neorhodopirellula pilleata]TWU01405.1 putative hydrolase YxeP [Neorhodopirellula pilleata]
MKEIRRYLHRRPELSEQEYETTQFVCELVDDLGLQANVAQEKRGVTVDLDSVGEVSRRRVAVRGDLDALPIQTRSTAEYASRHDGVMHACGHDAHTAIVWGVLAILNDLQKVGITCSPFRVRAIFQPAEETSTGGKHMIASGALEDVDSALALHVDPTRLVGTIGVRNGRPYDVCRYDQRRQNGGSFDGGVRRGF